MKKGIVLSWVFLFLSSFCQGQFSVSGTVKNTNGESLQGATAIVLNQDSTMLAFSITNEKGVFELQEISKGDFILQLSYVSFANVSQSFSITGDQTRLELGEILMTESNEVLQEVTIKAEHIPMGILGDTISYNTAAFKTKPGATVEDLLKRLPGIEVQRDGSIKAQGEDVENVLVDGKEFFGNDPKIATQNLEAQAVDKVQVYDKQSDIAEFTGIEDGDEEKTINLKLKEEYKSGGFGNIQLEGGTDKRYHSKLNYNRFNTNMQASAIVSANNINKQAFSFNEYISLMGGLNAAMSGNFNDFSFGEFGQSKTPKGITDNYTTGVNFNYDFSKKLTVRSNYFYLQSDRDLNQTSAGSQFLNSQTFSKIDTSHSKNNRQQHRIRTKFVYKQNPFTEIEYKNNIGLNGIDQILNGNSLFESANGINQTLFLNDVDNSGFDYIGSIQYRKKFGSKGRNWINELQYTHRQNDENSLVNNNFKFNNIVNNLNQEQFYASHEKDLRYQTKYTEPLGKGHYLGVQYTYQNNEESPKKEFFDVLNNRSFLNEELSASFIKNLEYHITGLSLKRNRKKSKLTVATVYQITQLSATLVESDISPNSSFNHILPSIYFDWDISGNTSLNTSYSTSIRAPQLQQLMPFPENSNPNLIINGNPMLRPSYTHSAQINYNVFDNFNFRNLFANLQLSVVKDRIINEVTIDDDFFRTITPINTDKFISLQSYLSYSEPIRALKLKYRISAQSLYSNYDSFLNNIKSNVSESNTYVSASVENRKKDLIDIATGIKVEYNSRSYAINESFNQQYFNYTFFLDGTWQINKSLFINSSVDMIHYSQENFSAVPDFLLWNATIEKSFKENKIAISLSAFDILGQNTGIERLGGFNSITDSRFNTLTRYISLGIRYRIGKAKKSGIQIQ